jgi:hypothetical protein
MKLASYHKSRGDDVKFVRGINNDLNFNPDKIEITSLFTYAWQPVHKAIEFYRNRFPDANMELGGIYASIMPERVKTIYPFLSIHIGLCKEAERYLPNYDILKDTKKWNDWDGSMIFASRGCVRRCPFCVVPRLEGSISPVLSNVQNYIYPGHKRIILLDNNFLASPNWKIILKELKEINLPADFNQGLDARLMDEEKAGMLANLKVSTYRFAYDYLGEKAAVSAAIDMLSDQGIKRRYILIYSLYNFYDENKTIGDTPKTFLKRINDVLEMGCTIYPMRFEPLNSLKKNQYISRYWKKSQLEAIARARRVIGYGGAFPPYEGLINKFKDASDFDDAFRLRPEKKRSNGDENNTKIFNI